MAKLWITVCERKDRPGKWRVEFQKGSERSAKTFPNEKEARLFERELRRGEDLGEFEVDEAPKTSLGEVVQDFLDSKEGLVRPNTLLTYRMQLEKSVVKGLGASRDVRALTREDVEGYLDGRRKAGVKPRTLGNELERIVALLGYLMMKKIVRHNIAADIAMPKVPDKAYDWLRTVEEVRAFLDAATGDFAKVALFTIYTGLRRREVVFLQRSDVDLANGVVQVRAKPELGFVPKSGKQRSVPIDPTLRPLLERRLQKEVAAGPGAWVFPQRDGSRRSPTTRWFAVATQETARRAGILRKLTFHDLRRTYGAMLIESGVNIYTVSRLLGHSDVRITEKVYAPLSGRFLADEAAKLGRHLGPALVREVAAVPALPAIGKNAKARGAKRERNPPRRAVNAKS